MLVLPAPALARAHQLKATRLPISVSFRSPTEPLLYTGHFDRLLTVKRIDRHFLPTYALRRQGLRLPGLQAGVAQW